MSGLKTEAGGLYFSYSIRVYVCVCVCICMRAVLSGLGRRGPISIYSVDVNTAETDFDMRLYEPSLGPGRSGSMKPGLVSG